MPEAGLLQLLQADGILTGLVSTRIYPTEAPPDAVLPYIVYDRTGSELFQYTGGSLCLERVDMEYECWATTYSEAKDIAKAVEDAILAKAQTMSDVRVDNVVKQIESNVVQPSLRGERKRIHGVLIEFAVWTSPI